MKNISLPDRFIRDDRLFFKILVVFVLLFFFKCLYFCGHTHCDFLGPTECCGQRYISVGDDVVQSISSFVIFAYLLVNPECLDGNKETPPSLGCRQIILYASDYIPITSYPLRGSPVS